MNITTLPVWSTPVSLANFGSEAKELNKQLVAEIFSEADLQKAPQEFWESKIGLEKRYPFHQILAESIERVCFAMMPKLGFGDHDFASILRVELWAQIHMRAGSYQAPQFIRNAVFAGYYYPTSGLQWNFADDPAQTAELYPDEEIDGDPLFRASDTPKPGDLILMDPAGTLKRLQLPDWVQEYPFFGNNFVLTPRQSQLVIFPNYIQHMLAPLTENDEMRLSIGFRLVSRTPETRSLTAEEQAGFEAAARDSATVEEVLPVPEGDA